MSERKKSETALHGYFFTHLDVPGYTLQYILHMQHVYVYNVYKWNDNTVQQVAQAQ